MSLNREQREKRHKSKKLFSILGLDKWSLLCLNFREVGLSQRKSHWVQKAEVLFCLLWSANDGSELRKIEYGLHDCYFSQWIVVFPMKNISLIQFRYWILKLFYIETAASLCKRKCISCAGSGKYPRIIRRSIPTQDDISNHRTFGITSNNRFHLVISFTPRSHREH